MQPRNPYEADDSSRLTNNTRMAREAELIEENERLRNAQAKHNTVAQGNRLARENERLRGEQAYRDSAGAVGGLVIGVLVFALAVLGIGAFFYLGRDLGSEQTQPTQSQPEATGEQDININVPQPPPITVEPPPQQRINVEVTPAPSATENRSATPPAIDTPAGATGASQAPVANPPVGDPVAPAATPAPQQGVN